MKLAKPNIAVIGAGSWGTALAILLARNGLPVRLWSHKPAEVELMQSARCNKKYLLDAPFPTNLTVFSDLTSCLIDVSRILIAIPSHVFREVLLTLKTSAQKNSGLAIATKGLDPKTYQLLHNVIEEIWGEIPVAILSGPTFAKEVAAGLPSAISVASYDPDYAFEWSEYLHNPRFRPYITTDVIGVELGGAIKNVIAIAVGISDGLGFGTNARSALITRGLTEIMRLGVALGGLPETFMGLAGLGDLVLTCTDNQSRNRRFGILLGEGKSVTEAAKIVGQVVEGAHNAIQVTELAKLHQIEMPICEQVAQILRGHIQPIDALTALSAREIKSEG